MNVYRISMARPKYSLDFGKDLDVATRSTTKHSMKVYRISMAATHIQENLAFPSYPGMPSGIVWGPRSIDFPYTNVYVTPARMPAITCVTMYATIFVPSTFFVRKRAKVTAGLKFAPDTVAKL